MARLPRFFIPGHPIHLIHRGNNGQALFKNRRDYQVYVDWLNEASERHGCSLHAYILMPNHVHLLLTPAHALSLPKTLQSVGRRFVQYFNTTHNRTGTLWEGRYRATLIDPAAYFLDCCRYMDTNPVRSGLAAHPRDYPWSSYPYYAHGKKDPLLTPHPKYQGLGGTPRERQAAYRALVRRPLDSELLQAIREATNKAWVLGSDRFKTKIAKICDRRLSPLPRGRPRLNRS